MKQNSRASIAYIAARIISHKRASSVYDYSLSRHLSIDGSIDNNINVYDYVQGCHISGSGISGNYDLYHYGDKHHINLKINGNEFEGYDYGSSCHYSGNVNGNSISLYDYGESKYYRYSI